MFLYFGVHPLHACSVFSSLHLSLTFSPRVLTMSGLFFVLFILAWSSRNQSGQCAFFDLFFCTTSVSVWQSSNISTVFHVAQWQCHALALIPRLMTFHVWRCDYPRIVIVWSRSDCGLKDGFVYFSGSASFGHYQVRIQCVGVCDVLAELASHFLAVPL